MPFKGHQYSLFLDYKLYLATVQLQADHGLGKAYSAMLPFVEGLHTMGYIEDSVYELYKRKYSVGLAESKKSPVQIQLEQTRAAERKAKNKFFGEVLAQWSELKPSSKAHHVREAEKYKTLKNAKLVLELGKQDKERLAIEP